MSSTEISNMVKTFILMQPLTDKITFLNVFYKKQAGTEFQTKSYLQPHVQACIYAT